MSGPKKYGGHQDLRTLRNDERSGNTSAIANDRQDRQNLHQDRGQCLADAQHAGGRRHR